MKRTSRILNRRALVIAAVLLAAAPVHARDAVLNPGFELGTYGVGVPDRWAVSGEGGDVVVDSAVAHAGSKSVRVSREPATGFTGIVQTTDARGWTGKMVLARAWFRQKDAIRPAIWVRADADELVDRRFLSVPVPRVQGEEWIQAQTLIDVPEKARRIAFGALLQSGTMWVDSFELVDPDQLQAPQPGARVSAYVDEAIAKIRAKALNAERVDWQRARARSLFLLTAGDEPAAAHASVRFLLAALADRHSVFHPPEGVTDLRAPGATGALGAQSRRIGALGYVSVPGFSSFNKERLKAFADDISSRIEAMRGACGWIVDLRPDTGGNMFPMISGLAAFFGEGPLGYYIDRSASKSAWSLATVMPIAGMQPPVGGGALRDAPVAVLMGPRTASSGEATLISFIGRPRTRTFGVPSAGRSTGNDLVELSDGSIMALTTVVMADRTGRAYGEKVSPDELALGDIGDAKDGALEAATKWLQAQAACAPVSEPPGTATR